MQATYHFWKNFIVKFRREALAIFLDLPAAR